MRCSDFNDAFPTLFLTLDLPVCPLLESDRRDENISVLNCLEDFLKSVTLPSDPSFAPWEDIARQIVNLHKDGQDPTRGQAGQPIHLSHEDLQTSLQATPVSKYRGLWVREQNATLLVQRLTTDKALVLAWEVQCPNSDITCNIGSPRQALPRIGTTVSWNRLVYSTELLIDLCSNPEEAAQPKSHKAGNSFHESRDVNGPLFVLDVLPCVLGGELLVQENSNLVGTLPNVKIDIFTKKMKDEVRYQSSAFPWRRAPIWTVLKGILHLVAKHETGDDVHYKIFIQFFLAFVLEGASGNKAKSSEMTVSASSLTEASRKLVRRLEKLKINYANCGVCVDVTG